MPHTSVIIVAAGSSVRMGNDKIFADVGGKTVIEYTIEAFERSRTTDEIVVVCNNVEKMRDMIRARSFHKVSCVCPGGENRAASVMKGLACVNAASAFVSIHDGARPLILPEDIDAVHSKAYETGAALCGYPSADTVKVIDKDGNVVSSPDRSTLFCAATPQTFEIGLYKTALRKIENAIAGFTDDASLVAETGARIATVVCRRDNFKLTTPEDFDRLLTVLKSRGQI